MTIDAANILAMKPMVTRQSFTRRDTVIYALGVGADELDFVFEDRLKALPTMATVLTYAGFFWREPRFGADWKKILHAEQSFEIHAPLPVEGELVGETTIDAIYDKGPAKGAIAYIRRVMRDANGAPIATARMATFLRGDGGCGGTEGAAPKPHAVPTDRAPDHKVTLATAANQALIYRLSGDYNPLHIDSDVAKAAGFDRPILHGLCTYGIVGRALIAALTDNDPTRLKRMDVRFSAPVYPGETICTEIWREGDGTAAFRASVVERDLLVLTHGYAEHT